MTAAKAKVEIGFGDSAFTDPASVTWTDVSAYVRLSDGISYSSGRNDETSSVQAGSATFTLNNDSGDFTPGYASGAHHPLPLRCPVRISGSIDGGSTYKAAWYGVVDEWESGWTNGVRGVTTVRCIDMIGLLQRTSLPSLLEAEMKAPSSLVYWFPIDNPATGADSTSFQYGGDSGPEADQLPAPRFTPDATASGAYSAGTWLILDGGISVGDGSGFSTAFWFRADPFETDVTAFGLHKVVDGSTFTLDINYSSNAIHATGSNDLSALNLSVALTHSSLDTGWHFVAYTESISGGTVTQTLRLDDTDTSSTRSDTGTIAPTTSAVWWWARSDTGYHKGSAARFGLYDAALSSTTLDAIWQAGTSATLTYTTLDLFDRVAAVVGGVQTLSSGTTSVTPTLPRTAGRSAMDVLNELAQVERGDVFADVTGSLTFYARSVRAANTTAYTTLDNDDVEQDVSFTYNDHYLTNRVIAYTAAGDTSDTSDATSVATYGEHLLSVQLPLESSTNVAAWASSVITDHKDPRPRCAGLSVDMVAKSATVATDILEVLPADMVTITGLPETGAPSSSVDLYVEGVSGVITPSSWRVTLNTSPHQFTAWTWT